MSLKKTLKKYIPHGVFKAVRDVLYPEKITILEDRMNAFFNTYYRDIASPAVSQKTTCRNAEFKVYSKHGCDGLLLHIFSMVGVTDRTFVEIGVEDGRECNTANLSLNFGWKGLLIEANKEWAESARQYYRERLKSSSGDVQVAECFVTAENINDTIREHGIQGEIDLLSIDIDSNDYWVWKAIDAIHPRVVVAEYNPSYGPSRSLTMKYDPNFYFQKVYREAPLYYGASLSALAKLGREKGYILVACDTHGHDAYFIRNDVVGGKFHELSPEEAFYPNPLTIERVGDTETQYEEIKHLPFEEV